MAGWGGGVWCGLGPLGVLVEGAVERARVCLRLGRENHLAHYHLGPSVGDASMTLACRRSVRGSGTSCRTLEGKRMQGWG